MGARARGLVHARCSLLGILIERAALPSSAVGMDDMDESAERVLHSLKVLSLLQSGDRLGEAQGRLCVRPPSLTTSMGRWLKGDCRQKDLQHVGGIFSDAFAHASRCVLVHQQHGGHAAARSVLRVYRGIAGALAGLRQMRLTYLGDVNSTAQLDVLRDKTQERADHLARWLRKEGLLEPEQRAGEWDGWVVEESGGRGAAPQPRRDERAPISAADCGSSGAHSPSEAF